MTNTENEQNKQEHAVNVNSQLTLTETPEFKAGVQRLLECEQEIFTATKAMRNAAKSLAMIVRERLWRFADNGRCESFENYIFYKGFERSYIERLVRYGEFLHQCKITPGCEPTESSVRRLLTKKYEGYVSEIYATACGYAKKRVAFAKKDVHDKPISEKKSPKKSGPKSEQELKSESKASSSETSAKEASATPSRTLSATKATSKAELPSDKNAGWREACDQQSAEDLCQDTTSPTEEDEQTPVFDIMPTAEDIREAIRNFEDCEDDIYLSKIDDVVPAGKDFTSGVLNVHCENITSASDLILLILDFRKKNELTDADKDAITEFLTRLHAKEVERLHEVINSDDTNTKQL